MEHLYRQGLDGKTIRNRRSKIIPNGDVGDTGGVTADGKPSSWTSP
jgi:hypothetical protein